MSVFGAVNGTLSAKFLVVFAHFLWQGAAIAAVLGVVLALMRGSAARARYAVSLAALLAMAVLPAGTFWAGGNDVKDVKAAGFAGEVGADEGRAADLGGEPGTALAGAVGADLRPAPGQKAELDSAAAGFTAETTEVMGAAGPESGGGGLEAGVGAGPARAGGPRLLRAVSGADWERYAPYGLAVYLAGVSLMLLRLAAALGGGKRLRRRSEPVEDGEVLQALARQARALGLKATPAVAWCGKVVTPTVVGVLRPMVLLPASAVTGLAPGQLELLLLHELAHVRRYDPLVNVLQRLIEAVLFFHPAVWWVSRCVRLEREHCCDDVVLAHGGEPRAYAESLLQAATLAHVGRAGLAPAGGIGALGGGTDLRKRMRRVLGLGAQPVRLLHGGAVFCLLAAGLAAAAFAGTSDLRAERETEPKQPALGVLPAIAAANEAAERPGGIPDTVAAPAEPGGPNEPPAAGAPPSAAQSEPMAKKTDDMRMLAIQIKDPDWWIRKLAAHELGTVEPTMSAVMLLTEALNDEKREVKVAAAESLGKLGHPYAVKYLVSTLKEEPPVQDAAVEALGKFPEEQVLPILKYAAVDENKDMQWGALKVLEGMDSDEALDVLVTVAPQVSQGSSSAHMRQTLCEKLLTYPWDQVEPRLRALVESGDVANRYKMLRFLGFLDKPELDGLLMKYAEAEDDDVRSSAVLAAAELVKTRAEEGGEYAHLIPVLRRGLREDSFYTRISAADALRAVSWEPPTDEDRAWYLVAQGEWEEASAMGPVALEPLLKAARTVSEREHLGAVQALVHFDDPRVFALLRELARNEGPSPATAALAVTAVGVLEEFGGDEAVDILVDAARTGDPGFQWYAADTLGRLRAEKGVPAIRYVVKRVPVNGANLFSDALAALVELGGESDVDDVAAALRASGRKSQEQIAAVHKIGGLGTERAAETLKRVYEEESASRQRGITLLASEIGKALQNSQSEPMRQAYEELRAPQNTVPPPQRQVRRPVRPQQ